MKHLTIRWLGFILKTGSRDRNFVNTSYVC